MLGEDYKNRFISYLENFYEISDNDKQRLIVDDSLFLRTVCCSLKQLITELQFSVKEIRIGAIESESVIIPVQMKIPSWKGDGYVWDLERLRFMLGGENMPEILWKCTIPLKPKTKKNHNRIVQCNGKPRPIPSKEFEAYQKDCKWFIKPPIDPIDCKCNIKAVYYMSDRRRVDITNLHNALHDVLVHFEVIKDDNCKIVVGTDGSRVKVDKQNPRTEVTITKVEEITGFEV